MAYCIKETLKVEVNYISVALIHYLLRSSQCVMAAPFRTEAITCHGELTLINWCKNLVYGLLHQPVYHGRNTQKAFLAIVLRDLNPADWIGTICPLLQGTYKLTLISQKPWEQLFA